MKLDGREIAETLLDRIKSDVDRFRIKKTIPKLSVFLLGDDKSSRVYVNQKIKTANKLGIDIVLHNPASGMEVSDFINLLKMENRNPDTHGIIIQRPLPLTIDREELDLLVPPEKDVDGFHPGSLFDPPVALAVMEILAFIHPENTADWLSQKKILIIGRGVTAGRPIAKYLSKININFSVAHSQTDNLSELISTSEIIISCVGKSNVVRHQYMNSKVILIGVGLHDENGKLKPDYDQDQAGQTAAFYTPVPGGVGPVNVAKLMGNVIKAAGLNQAL